MCGVVHVHPCYWRALMRGGDDASGHSDFEGSVPPQTSERRQRAEEGKAGKAGKNRKKKRGEALEHKGGATSGHEALRLGRRIKHRLTRIRSAVGSRSLGFKVGLVFAQHFCGRHVLSATILLGEPWSTFVFVMQIFALALLTASDADTTSLAGSFKPSWTRMRRMAGEGRVTASSNLRRYVHVPSPVAPASQTDARPLHGGSGAGSGSG
jgi:hypothetical protein